MKSLSASSPLLTMTAVMVGSLVKAVTVENKIIEIEGRSCNGSDKFQARVFHPTDTSNRYPILSFAHGAVSPAWFADALNSYNFTVSGVAAAGYIIVAPGIDCVGFTGLLNQLSVEQIDSLTFLRAKDSVLKDIIDFNASTGVFGHSMGAEATLITANDTQAVQSAKIGTALPLHPGRRYASTLTRPVVPTMYWTGDADVLSTPASVKTRYDMCSTNVDRGFALFKGENHFGPTGNASNKEVKWIVAWMDCHIKGDSAACDKVFGSGGDSMCAAQEFSACEIHKANDSEAYPRVTVV